MKTKTTKKPMKAILSYVLLLAACYVALCYVIPFAQHHINRRKER